jgi:hypothetical protein
VRKKKKKKKLWTRSTGRGPHPASVHGGPRRCGQEHGGTPTGASASGHSSLPALSGDSWGGGVGHGGLAPGLTGAQEVVERRRDDGEGGGGGALCAGLLGAWREGKEGQGRSGEERIARAPFYRVGGGAGRLDGEGNQVAGGGVPLWPSGLVGSGKIGGEWGVKRGESAALFPGEEGALRRHARTGGGGIRLHPGEEGSWAGPTR